MGEVDSVHVRRRRNTRLEIFFVSGTRARPWAAFQGLRRHVVLDVRMTAQLAELVRDLFRSQHEIDTAGFDRIARHPRESSGLRLLRKDDSACLLDGPHTARTVRVATREHDTDRRAAAFFGERDEERVDRQVQSAARRATFEMKTLAGESQGGIGRNDVDMRRLHDEVVFDLHDPHPRFLRQQLRQQARVRGIEVLYEDVGHRP